MLSATEAKYWLKEFAAFWLLLWLFMFSLLLLVLLLVSDFTIFHVVWA